MILRILREFDSDETFEFQGPEATIGRDTENSIVILDDLVSRRHARISFDGGQYALEDLNSTNGTYLNGTPVERALLSSGDKINIGKATLIVQETPAGAKPGKPLVQIVDNEKSRSANILAVPPEQAALFLQPSERADLETLRRENETLKKLFRLNSFLPTTRNIQVLMDKVIELCFEMLKPDSVCILLLSEKTGELEVKSLLSRSDSPTVTVSRTVVNHVLEKSRSVLSTDMMDDARFDPRKSIITANIQSVVCTPILVAGQTQGIFYADIRSLQHRFTEDDLKIMTILANMIGMAMENDFWHREALRKERLSAIGEVITGLSHYAKNILNGLRLAIQALDLSISTNSLDKAQKSLKAIMAQEKRISSLVLNMLDYSKERVPIKQKINLREILEDIADPYQDFFREKNISFVMDVDSAHPEIYADVTGMHRVLLNLFTNALDAIRDSSAGVLKFTMRANLEKKQCIITSEDNGVGIQKKFHQKIFDVFYSTKNFEGTGLGLAVVKKIIAEHGGTVAVESEPGKGARFIISLPLE